MIFVYTDGSYNHKEDIGGYGVYMEFHFNNKITYKRIYGEVRSTNQNILELYAIVEALKYLKNVFLKSTIKIFTDSKYIDDGIRKDRKDPSLWIYFKSLLKDFTDVEIIWQKADKLNNTKGGNSKAHYLSKKYRYDRAERIKKKKEMKGKLELERNDLFEKIIRLEDFITTSQDFKELSKEHKNLLINQLSAMKDYLSCLESRIELIDG